MPRGSWSSKDERQYKHIKKSCMARGRGKKTCERIAAATVNKTRSNEGRTLTGRKKRTRKLRGTGCGCSALKAK
jgi:hypothetical protein